MLARREFLSTAVAAPVISIMTPFSESEKEIKRNQLLKLVSELYGRDSGVVANDIQEVNSTTFGNIVLWKLGVITDNPQTCILPTKSAIDKLRTILSANVPDDGRVHIVWGPELDVKCV